MSMLAVFIAGLIMIRVVYKRLKNEYAGVKERSDANAESMRQLQIESMDQLSTMLETIKRQDSETESLVNKYVHLSGVMDRSLALNLDLLRDSGVSEQAIEGIILALKDRESGGYKTFTHRFRVVLKEKSSK